MTQSWSLAVDREDLSHATLFERPVPALDQGEVLLRVDRVGLTANNVTYAVLGESFRYWDFFPAEPGWGHVPLWGFAEVAESTVKGVEVGSRVYGYLPPASHLVVRPSRVDARGFRDGSSHRSELPSPYNVYALSTSDPAYDADREDLMVVYRPLFYTSFMLADQLQDNDFFGARSLVLSSASSKTAYAAAFLLQGTGAEVVGLTSASNVAFTESLGCYDRVLSYDAVHDLDPGTETAYLDLAGNSATRARIRAHLRDNLVHESVVGVTHQDEEGAEALSGPRTTVFFAPDQMRKRKDDWGREGLDKAFAEAWHRFIPAVEGWVDVVTGDGPEALRKTWLEVLAGGVDPRQGHVITL
jgi:NADPH:quinone reductase-like Zn-dependent oxidoreductase